MKGARYTVTPFINLTGRFTEYDGTHTLAEQGRFVFLTDDVSKAADRMWEVGNRMARDAEGRAWPDSLRSMSVGDVIVVADFEQVTFLACDRFGWRILHHPPEHIPLPTQA